ncbi:hypothetical protein O1R50_22390 [Glycomyces luteolus]|uniref:Uncharacterized protein n=1 Tax=Glycomyces luteolus TaxID=2670330 RepID=A0A9X3PBP5_9ACTN|nr:hypothetical protein [Glycomyces luteolus]MDA1362391.1 hypothetical protein [Glycomyces luteolus]
MSREEAEFLEEGVSFIRRGSLLAAAPRATRDHFLGRRRRLHGNSFALWT